MRNLQVVEISQFGALEPEDFGCCPLCDNGIEEYEPVVILVCSGCIPLAHEDCVEEEGWIGPQGTAD